MEEEMVKRIWSSNKNVESFVVIFLSMLVMFISAASIDINLLGIFLLPIPIMLLCLKFNWKISVLIIGISSVINIFTYGVSGDRKSTRLNSQSRQYLVCRLLLEKK